MDRNTDKNFVESSSYVRSVYSRYSSEDKHVFAQYKSLHYFSPCNKVYKKWLREQPVRTDLKRWLLMGLIGLLVGIVGFLLRQVIDFIYFGKMNIIKNYIKKENYSLAYFSAVFLSLILVFFSAAATVIFSPAAAGSGLPEIIAYLNGTTILGIFDFKTMVAKFISCCLAVSSGLPVGSEGPMTHLGACIGSVLSQFRLTVFGSKIFSCTQFRAHEDKIDFISAGAAAGIAAAFRAPLGALLFCMEEISSFWNLKLSWQIFFCCMISSFTSDFFNSAFSAFHVDGDFGSIRRGTVLFFEVKSDISIGVQFLMPTVIIGIIGGLLGAVFIFTGLKFYKGRKLLVQQIKSESCQKAVQILEPMIIMVVMAVISIILPSAYACTNYTCHHNNMNETICVYANTSVIEDNLEEFSCPDSVSTYVDGIWSKTGSYNGVASLLFKRTNTAIEHLFSRDTGLQFTLDSLFLALVLYFFMSSWASTTAIAADNVDPMIFLGALVGRIVGNIVIKIGHYLHTSVEWADPGGFALIGSAAFFGGVSRLTVSLTVIMVEITNDIQYLLFIMVGIMLAKWFGDSINKPYYFSVMDFKCIPHLHSHPIIMHGKKCINLELYEARHVMTSDHIATVNIREKVINLAEIVLDFKHTNYPVVKITDENLNKTFCGTISRSYLCVLLCHEDIFELEENADLSNPKRDLDYSLFDDDEMEKLEKSPEFLKILRGLLSDTYNNIYINLDPYINESAPSVYSNFSLNRTYMLFRSRGMSFLVIIDRHNQVVGVISRQDLLEFKIEEKIISLSELERES